MAQFDPSIISEIPDYAGDPTGSMEKGIGIADALDRTQLNKLHLGQEQRAEKEDQQVQAILKQSDYTTPEGLAKTAAAVNKVSPNAAMGLLKTGQQYQSGQVAAQLDQLSLLEKRQDLIVSAIDPIVAQARDMKNKGASDLDIKAFITQQMPQAVQGLRGMTLPDGKPALPDDQLKMVTSIPGGYTLQTLEGWEAKSKQGAAAIKSRLEQFKADTAGKAQATREASESEKERHDRETEAHATRQEAIAAHKAQGFDDRQSELLAALADRNVSLPAGLRSQAQIAATINGLFAKHPDQTADEIADGIKSGKLKLTAETKGAQTAGTQIGKVALASNELDTFGDQTLQASQDIPRGNFVPWQQLKNMANSKISDPKLLRFKAKMQALENAYNQLAARSGTDVDKRQHIHELFNIANGPEAVATLVRSLKEEASGARDAADRTIAETSGTSIPGAGGTPPSGAAPQPGAASPAPGGGAAPGGPQKLQPGQTYKHASGATVEILN
jgi:hypothetical protein